MSQTNNRTDSTHPNALLLQKMYADFVRGDTNAMLDVCADNVTFQLAGKSKLAGKYTKANFGKDFLDLLNELSGGTFKFDAHDILASDRHGLVLATTSLMRDGKKVELRTVHVWRFENGKPVAGYEYTRDLYLFDATWT